MKKKILYILLFMMQINFLFAQSSPEMADVMRSNGKIYVVVAVLAIIFSCIIIYLFMLDRKISKLEKSIQENQKTKM